MVKINKSIIYVIISSLLLCLAHASNAEPMNTPVDTASYTEASILAAINAYRVKHHFKPLKISHLITEEATRHSRDMAEQIVPFGHDRFSQRINRLFESYPYAHGAAENVAYSFPNAKDAVQQWLESPGHLRNIEGNYNLTGIGIARDQHQKVYVTQIFLRSDNG